MFSLLAFSLAFISSLGIRMFTLCHCILEVCNFLFYFIGITVKRLSLLIDRLSLSREFRLKFLNNVGTAKIFGYS